ncbi:hypothetical protein GQ600_9309 [Phytophthora cactorum]|nr:hypothetical protein GQ600_9309 [Phytophthora cactorum]
MRLVLVLLVAAATALLVSGSTITTQADAGTRSLRSFKKVVIDDAAAEERASFAHAFDFSSKELSALQKLNTDQFHRMATQPAYLETILKSWNSGIGTLDDAAVFMSNQGVSDSAIRQFISAYYNYVKHSH